MFKITDYFVLRSSFYANAKAVCYFGWGTKLGILFRSLKKWPPRSCLCLWFLFGCKMLTEHCILYMQNKCEVSQKKIANFFCPYIWFYLKKCRNVGNWPGLFLNRYFEHEIKEKYYYIIINNDNNANKLVSYVLWFNYNCKLLVVNFTRKKLSRLYYLHWETFSKHFSSDLINTLIGWLQTKV